jgi:hypothetical protein
MMAQLIAHVEKAGGDEKVTEAIRNFHAGGSGLWVVLNREGCNALIEKVRKARNAAFGRDE